MIDLTERQMEVFLFLMFEVLVLILGTFVGPGWRTAVTVAVVVPIVAMLCVGLVRLIWTLAVLIA